MAQGTGPMQVALNEPGWLSVAQILPTLQRLTEIVDPLDNTVARLGRFVDHLPGGRRTAARGTSHSS